MVGIWGGVGLREIRAALLLKNDFKKRKHILGSSQCHSRRQNWPRKSRKAKWMMWSLLSWVVKEQANLVSDGVFYGVECKKEREIHVYI